MEEKDSEINYATQISNIMKELRKIQLCWELERSAIIEKWTQSDTAHKTSSKDLMESINQLKERSKAYQEDNDRLSSENHRLIEEKTLLTKQVSQYEANDKQSELISLISTLQNRLDSSEVRKELIAELETKLSVASIQIDDLIKTKQLLEDKVKQKEEEALKAYTQIAESRMKSSTQVAQLESKCALLQSQIQEKSYSIPMNSYNSNFSNRNTFEMQIYCEQIQQKLNMKSMDLQKVEMELSRKQTTILDNIEQLSAAHEKISKLQEEIGVKSAKLQESEKIIAQQNETIESLKTELASKDENINALTTNINNVEAPIIVENNKLD